jgi:hypothetical protein
MCRGCYENEWGEPKIVNDRTREVAALINRIYDFNPCGGNAHVVVDDWNLDGESIQFCLGQVAQNPNGDSAEQLEVERNALSAMLDMTEDERASAMAIASGWLGVEGGGR